jgi:hypothetical protein
VCVSKFPNEVYEYLISKGFKQESETRLSFSTIPAWEKICLTITDCKHYSLKIFNNMTPERVVFSGFRIEKVSDLVFLLSRNVFSCSIVA